MAAWARVSPVTWPATPAIAWSAIWDNGLRHISNRLRPIRRPEDCRGMRIRTLDNATYRQALAAMGFTPLTIDVKDLVRAVETHAVDAQENPLTNTVHFGLHKTHKHLSLTSHFHGVALLLANRAWLEALPAPRNRPCWPPLPTRRRRSGSSPSPRMSCAWSSSGATASPSCPRRRSTSPPSARRSGCRAQ